MSRAISAQIASRLSAFITGNFYIFFHLTEDMLKSIVSACLRNGSAEMSKTVVKVVIIARKFWK